MWQKLQDRFAKDGLQVVGVAVDAQGAAAARPWYEKHVLTYPRLVDATNALGRALGYKVVPNQFYVDELGIFHGNVNEEELVELLKRPRRAVSADVIGEIRRVAADSASGVGDSVAELMSRAAERLAAGEKDAAADALRSALKLDPENWLIRKQIWAVEHPEKFYEGGVDYAWQKAQLRRERAGE